MIELPRSSPKPPDPHQKMVGVCASCKTPVETERNKTIIKRGAWVDDTPCVECFQCGAVVYVMAKPPVDELETGG